MISDSVSFLKPLGLSSQRRSLDQVVMLFQDLEDTLVTGMVPSHEKWEQLRALPNPWGSVSVDSLKELRDCGASLIPTLRRLKGLAEAHRTALEEARSKSSQALAQVMVCSFFVPVLGFGLYHLLPGMQNFFRFWLCCCGGALILSGIGALWLLQMTEVARWGGLKASRRSWILASQCAGERFLAVIRTGVPPDLAWAKSCELLTRVFPEGLGMLELVEAWGYSVWDTPIALTKTPMERTIVEAGSSIRKAVQVCLMEGRPCTERVETVLLALRQDIGTHVEKELTLLATRALKPLFICVAPALLGLLACGLWVSTQEIRQAGFFDGL